MKSLEEGHKYIWQSLPRALQLWFEWKDEDSGNESDKIFTFMHQQLGNLDKYKLATALQILLSRYNHPNDRVREAIIDVLSKLAAQYPS